MENVGKMRRKRIGRHNKRKTQPGWRKWLRFSRSAAFETLEPRQLLAVDLSLMGENSSDVTLEFELSYGAGESVADIEDVYVQTSGSAIEWSDSGNAGDFTTVKVDGSDFDVGDYDSITVKMVYEAQSDEDFVQFQNSDISVLHVGDFIAPGTDLKFTGLRVRVDDDSTVSTRDLDVDETAGSTDHESAASEDDSGDLVIKAPKIRVKDGAALLTHADGDYAAGEIKLEAVDSLDAFASAFGTIPLLPNISITNAAVTLDDATVKGGDVTITTESDSADLFDDNDPGPFDVSESLAELIGSVSLIGGAAVSLAAGELAINGGSIEADNLTMTSEAITDARVRTTSVGSLAVSYGQSAPTAKVTIKDGATINVAGNVEIESKANTEMSVAAVQNLFGLSLIAADQSITLAAGYSDVTSKTIVSPDSSITAGGDLNIRSVSNRNLSVSSNASALASGELAISAALNLGETVLEAHLDGDTTVGGEIDVVATLGTQKNDTAATSGVGTGFVTKKLQEAGVASAVKLLAKIGQAMSLEPDALNGSENEKGTAGAIAFGFHDTDVTARIGSSFDDPTTVVSQTGDIRVVARAKEKPEVLAQASVTSSSGGAPLLLKGFYESGARPGLKNTRDESTAVAIGAANFQTKAKAYIRRVCRCDGGWRCVGPFDGRHSLLDSMGRYRARDHDVRTRQAER